MKNQVIDSERNGYGTELDDILFSIHEQPAIDPKELEERFLGYVHCRRPDRQLGSTQWKLGVSSMILCVIW